MGLIDLKADFMSAFLFVISLIKKSIRTLSKDSLIAISAIIISLISLYLNVYEVDLNKKEMKKRLRVEVNKVLNDAWDEIGGTKGTLIINPLETKLSPQRVSNAMRLLNEAKILDEQNPQIYFMLGILYEIDMDFNLAINSYDKAISLGDEITSYQSKIRLAHILGLLIDKRSQLYMLEEIHNSGISNQNLLFHFNQVLTTTLIENNEYDKAEIIATDLIDMKPWSCSSHSSLGIILLRKKEYDNAKKHLKNSIALCPNNQVAEMNLGEVYFQEKNYLAAIKHFKNASKLGSDKYDGAFFSLAAAYMSIGDISKTEESLKKVLEINPKNALAHIHLGELSLKNNIYKQARIHYSNALDANNYPQSIKVSDELIYRNLIVIEAQLGNIELATNYMNQLEEQYSESSHLKELKIYLNKKISELNNEPSPQVELRHEAKKLQP